MNETSPELLSRVRNRMEQATFYLMMGFIIGFLMFYRIFPYFSAPMNADMPTWVFVIMLAGLGALSGYLYPEIADVMASSVVLTISGAVFCFAIFVSPALSPDIITGSMFEELAYLVRLMLFDMMMIFLVTFISGFLATYFFEPE